MADIPTDPAVEWGKVVLFIGNEAEHWTPEQFAEAAAFARAHGVDTIAPKRADGSIKWYDTPAHLEEERAAVLAKGAGYLPWAYCYGPKFGIGQVRDECAVLAEMMSDNHFSVLADLEAEWNGQPGAASLFSSLMRPIPGLLGVSSWADPFVQDFPVREIAPCVNAWIPQDYDNWLVACEQQQIQAGMSIRFAALDLTQEFGANSVVGNATLMRERGHRTLFLWEFEPAEANLTLLDEVVKAFRGE